MNKIQWTRRTTGALAVAFVGAAAVGALAFGGSVSAQSQNPPATTPSPLMPGKRGPGGFKMRFGSQANSPMAVAAKALGIDEAALRTELQSGKTIADVAKARGVDSAKIITAIVDAQKADVAQAVTDGKLTQAQAEEILANAETHAANHVNNTAPMGPGGPGGRGGRGGDRGLRIGNPANAPLAVAAKVLGIDEAALRTELQSGKTIADVAKVKGVDSAKIITAIVDAQKADVAQAVTDGKLTQAQAEQILADAETHAANHVNNTAPMGPGGPGGPGGRGGRGGPGGFMMGNPANAPLAVAAKAIGIDEAALRTEMQSGKTIADVAKTKGVDSAKVVAAIVDARKADLAQAVTDGKLTQAQADQMLANAAARATDLVNGKAPTGRPNGGRGPRPGFGYGQQAPGNEPAAPAATGEGA